MDRSRPGARQGLGRSRAEAGQKQGKNMAGAERWQELSRSWQGAGKELGRSRAEAGTKNAQDQGRSRARIGQDQGRSLVVIKTDYFIPTMTTQLGSFGGTQTHLIPIELQPSIKKLMTETELKKHRRRLSYLSLHW